MGSSNYLIESLRRIFSKIDWILLSSSVFLVGAGLVTMNSFVAGQNYFFEKQIIWAIISIAIFLY